jgi:uncharacterized protein (DUF4415 family)
MSNAAENMRTREVRSRLLLSVKEVCELVGVKDHKAREIMLSLPHVRVGKLLKISTDVIDRWFKSGGNEYQCRASTKRREPGSSGAVDEASTGSVGTSRRSKPNRLPRSLPLEKLSDALLLTPVGKRKRGSR